MNRQISPPRCAATGWRDGRGPAVEPELVDHAQHGGVPRPREDVHNLGCERPPQKGPLRMRTTQSLQPAGAPHRGWRGQGGRGAREGGSRGEAILWGRGVGDVWGGAASHAEELQARPLGAAPQALHPLQVLREDLDAAAGQLGGGRGRRRGPGPPAGHRRPPRAGRGRGSPGARGRVAPLSSASPGPGVPGPPAGQSLGFSLEEGRGGRRPQPFAWRGGLGRGPGESLGFYLEEGRGGGDLSRLPGGGGSRAGAES